MSFHQAPLLCEIPFFVQDLDGIFWNLNLIPQNSKCRWFPWESFHSTLSADYTAASCQFSGRMMFITIWPVSCAVMHLSLVILVSEPHKAIAIFCQCVAAVSSGGEGRFLFLSLCSKAQGFTIRSWCSATDIAVCYRIFLSLAWFLRKQYLGTWAHAHLLYPLCFPSTISECICQV